MRLGLAARAAKGGREINPNLLTKSLALRDLDLPQRRHVIMQLIISMTLGNRTNEWLADEVFRRFKHHERGYDLGNKAYGQIYQFFRLMSEGPASGQMQCRKIWCPPLECFSPMRKCPTLISFLSCLHMQTHYKHFVNSLVQSKCWAFVSSSS